MEFKLAFKNKEKIRFNWNTRNTCQNVRKTMLGPSKEVSPFCQRSIFNRSSVKYKVLGSHKPSSTDNPKQRKLLLVSSSDTAPVIGQSCRTHTRWWLVITAGKKGLSFCLDIIALCNTICNNSRAGQATATLSLLVS